MRTKFHHYAEAFSRHGLGCFLFCGAVVILTLLAGARLWTVRPPGVEGEKKPAIVVGPYLQDAWPDGITISWETDWRYDTGRVEYGRTSGYGKVSEKEGEFTPCQSFIHHHALSGLEPGTLYHYRVISGGAESADYIFKTAPAVHAPVQFVVYGDSRSALSGYRSAHGEVIRSIMEDSPADIVLNTGDLVDNGGLCRGWEEQQGWKMEFFDPAAPLISAVPVYTVAGNHEYYASPAPHLFIDPPVLYLNYFDPGKRGTTYYSFPYGCVRFIVLDSNANTRSGNFLPGTPQRAWIEEQLLREEPRWTVVLLHHPPFASRKADEACRAVREHLVPLFERYRVPLVFAGHHHFYERSLKDGIQYITTAGGGGPLYKDDRPDCNPYRIVSTSVMHHCHVAAGPDGITVTAKDTRGAQLDRVTIEKRGQGRLVLPPSFRQRSLSPELHEAD